MLTFAQVKKRPAPAFRRSPWPAAAGLGPTWHDNRALVRRALHGPALQTKLTMGQPGDRFEQEADRVADVVMRMPAPDERLSTQGGRPGPEAIQRMCAECSEELQGAPDRKLQRQPLEEIEEGEEEGVVAAKEIPGQTLEVTPGLQSRIASLRGGGSTLPESARAFFEPRFGHDFSGVRIHSDARAAEAAQAVNARAFTLGRDIVFGAGQYAPETPGGKRLMAHELAHVIQQKGDHAGIFGRTGDSDVRSGQEELLQTKEAPGQTPQGTPWLSILDEILPPVGLVADINRVVLLLDIFDYQRLRAHVELIRASTEATKFTMYHGVPGIVALYDTRRGTQLDVAEARRALKNFGYRYEHASLDKLRLLEKTCQLPALAPSFTVTAGTIQPEELEPHVFGNTTRWGAYFEPLKACKENNQWRFSLSKLDVYARVDLKPSSFTNQKGTVMTDVTSANVAAINGTNWKIVVSSLNPVRRVTYNAKCSGEEYPQVVMNYPRRTEFWSREITGGHENYHLTEWTNVYRKELIAAENKLRALTVSEADVASEADALKKATTEALKWFPNAYQDATKTFCRTKEVDAYNRDEPHYKQLVADIRARAVKEKWK